MDSKTRYMLHKISGSVANKKRMESAVKVEKPLVDEKPKVEHAIKQLRSGKVHNLNSRQAEQRARMLENGLKSGVYDRGTTVIDEKKSTAIENEIGTRVEQAIRDGKIPPAQRDDFMKRLDQKRQQKR